MAKLLRIVSNTLLIIAVPLLLLLLAVLFFNVDKVVSERQLAELQAKVQDNYFAQLSLISSRNTAVPLTPPLPVSQLTPATLSNDIDNMLDNQVLISLALKEKGLIQAVGDTILINGNGQPLGESKQYSDPQVYVQLQARAAYLQMNEDSLQDVANKQATSDTRALIQKQQTLTEQLTDLKHNDGQLQDRLDYLNAILVSVPLVFIAAIVIFAALSRFVKRK